MQRIRVQLLIVGLWLLTTAVIAQKPTGGAVRWVTFRQLDSLQRAQPRPVFVYLNTSWCGYCHMFSRTTLRHTDVVRRLNEEFYCVNFDAESREPVVFQGKTYQFRPTGVGTGQHELATWLMQPYNDAAYPALLFRNSNFDPLTAVFSALPRQSFETLLDAVATRHR